MPVLANVLGLCAVACFVISYQMKARRSIIVLGAISRILYVLQYVLLGAFDGALLDMVAFVISLLCSQTEKGFVKKHFALTVVLSNVLIVSVGMLTYRNIFSLFPILGVIFEILALWLKKEKNIRLVSLFGAPFWMMFNIKNAAYGSVVGNVITLVSLTIAILRYDILKKEQKPPIPSEICADS